MVLVYSLHQRAKLFGHKCRDIDCAAPPKFFYNSVVLDGLNHPNRHCLIKLCQVLAKHRAENNTNPGRFHSWSCLFGVTTFSFDFTIFPSFATLWAPPQIRAILYLTDQPLPLDARSSPPIKPTRPLQVTTRHGRVAGSPVNPDFDFSLIVFVDGPN